MGRSLLLLPRSASKGLPWQLSGTAPDGQDQPRCHNRHATEQKATSNVTSTAKAATVFGLAASATLVAGVVLERSGDALADQIGLTGVLSGATVLAAATSLPELFSGRTTARNGASS